MIARRTLAALAISCGGAAPALAHTGFVLPDSFAYERCSGFGAIAAFSDYFPAPEVALTADFRLTGPDGKAIVFDRIRPDHAMTRLEASLSLPGTYRLTTGERLGRKGRVARAGSTYIRLSGEEADALPEGAEILSSQTATVSDAYFTCGAETPPADTAPAGRLAILPAEIFPGPHRPAVFAIAFDGAPLAPEEAFLVAAYGHYTGAPEDGVPLAADEEGRIVLEALAPGIYSLLVRHIAPAPDGAETDLRSYSSVLTFAVSPAPANAE